MGLAVVRGGSTKNLVFVLAAQDNNQGGDDSIYPNGWHGTAIRFGAIDNKIEDSTTRLGNSVYSPNGSVYLQLSGETNASDAMESFSNVTGVLTLAYQASTATMTGFFNGVPVGSYSLGISTLSLPLTLVVWGGSGSGVPVPAGSDTANEFSATETISGECSITVSASPNEGGTVSGGGTFALGSSQTVTGKANNGYTFANWTENSSVVSASARYNFTLSSNVDLVANFVPKSNPILTITSPKSGQKVSNADQLVRARSQTRLLSTVSIIN